MFFLFLVNIDLWPSLIDDGFDKSCSLYFLISPFKFIRGARQDGSFDNDPQMTHENSLNRACLT